MWQLIAHLVGDYVLQNHFMATKKTSSWFWAALHALAYGLPFLLLVDHAWQWGAIVATHVLIDRYRLARYWVEFWGIGCAGWLPNYWHRQNQRNAVMWMPESEVEDLRVEAAPPFLAVWLLIIVDNTMHLAINALVLAST